MQSTDLKPPLGSVAFFTHQDYQSEQYQIAYVHQPVKLQDHGIIKKRKGDHDNKPRNYTRHLFGLLGRSALPMVMMPMMDSASISMISLKS